MRRPPCKTRTSLSVSPFELARPVAELVNKQEYSDAPTQSLANRDARRTEVSFPLLHSCSNLETVTKALSQLHNMYMLPGSYDYYQGTSGFSSPPLPTSPASVTPPSPAHVPLPRSPTLPNAHQQPRIEGRRHSEPGKRRRSTVEVNIHSLTPAPTSKQSLISCHRLRTTPWTPVSRSITREPGAAHMQSYSSRATPSTPLS